MLTTEDIQNLSAVLATKEDIQRLDSRISKVEESLIMLTNSVDSLAKTIKDLQIEYHAVLGKINRMEDWIKKASAKLGIDFNQ
jgi:archaellum component FlaC